ncbi:MAG: hypothetical protein ACE5LG_06055 [Anaerolineae bacterium]
MDKIRLKSDPTEWLLSEGQPWVRYRAMVDLLDKPEEDSEVEEARTEMLEHPQVQSLIEELRKWPGYPLKRHNDAKHPLHKLAVLADFGLRADDPGMGEIVEKVMAHQSPEGAFQTVVLVPKAFGGTGKEMWTWMLCDAPTVLYALLGFGLGAHPAVQQAVEHLTSLIRDNGWPCAASPDLGKFRGPGRKADPCPYTNLLALKALAQVPEMRDSEAAHIGAKMLLGHWEHQKERKIYLFGIGTDFRKLKYPFIWYDILHVTDVLSRFPSLKNDPRLQEMVETLVAQQDERGRFTASSVWMAWRAWEFGQKKEPSPWITLLALRIIKRLYG